MANWVKVWVLVLVEVVMVGGEERRVGRRRGFQVVVVVTAAEQKFHGGVSCWHLLSLLLALIVPVVLPPVLQREDASLFVREVCLRLLSLLFWGGG